MPFVWKPLPGTTGITKPPKDSVIVNHKKGWKLDELEKFCVLKAGFSAKSKEGRKRINELAKSFTAKDTYYYLKKEDGLYYPVDQEKDKCSWLQFATTQYVKRDDRYRGCAHGHDKSCTNGPIIGRVKGHETSLCCRKHTELNAKTMQDASILVNNLVQIYLQIYGEEFVMQENTYFSINPYYKEDPDHDYEEEEIISINFEKDRIDSWGDIHPAFVLPITAIFDYKEGVDELSEDYTEDEVKDWWKCLSQTSPLVELRPDVHDMIEKMRLHHSASCAASIEKYRKSQTAKAKVYVKGDAKPLDGDELKDSEDTGIMAIKMTDQTNDLIGSSKCAVDEDGNIIALENIRKMWQRAYLFMVDEHGHPLNLKDITMIEVSTIEDLQIAYQAHDYKKDGPAIFSYVSSRATDQDSAWLVERSHQGYCTKNKIKNHIEDNHWNKGGASSSPYSVATVTIYKDFLRAARDPKKTHRLNSSSFPALKKRMWIHQTSNPNHWEAEKTGARDKHLKQMAQRRENRKERKRKFAEMEK